MKLSGRPETILVLQSCPDAFTANALLAERGWRYTGDPLDKDGPERAVAWYADDGGRRGLLMRARPSVDGFVGYMLIAVAL